MSNQRLLTRDYGLLLGANFLLYFAFYLLLPVLPFYLTEVFATGPAAVGVLLSCYTVASLCIRPFSGFVLDGMARKPLYIVAYLVFVAVFAGYALAGLLWVFVVLRVVHGLAFGVVTVAGNTLAIDITPSPRRGEAVGYYGLMNNTAMSIGPMMGLFLHHRCSFVTLFLVSFAAGLAGLLAAGLVRTPAREVVKREAVGLDRFVLLPGIPAGVSLLLLSVPYGMTTTYIAVYARELGLAVSPGLFFTFLAVGMAVSRIFAGRRVDRGQITQVILGGLRLVCVCFFALWGCSLLLGASAWLAQGLFLGVALGLGVGFGTMFPAFNTLFVNLAPHNRRGTATSTYLTSWDVGLGLGLVSGGVHCRLHVLRHRLPLGRLPHGGFAPLLRLQGEATLP